MVTLILAGVLVSAAFEPIGIWFLATLGYAIFFYGLEKSRAPIRYSFLFGTIANGIVLHWSSKYVGALPWLLLTFLQALFYLPIGVVFKRSRSLTWMIFTLLICEEIRARFPFGGFGWTRIAFSQVGSPYLKLVSVGGVLLLSYLTLLAALAIRRFSLKYLALLALLTFAIGWLPQNDSELGRINVAAVQGNTPEVGIEFNSRAKAVFELHLKTTRKLVQRRFDAIVWPENAIDVDPRSNPEITNQITELVKDLDTPLIAGAVIKQNGAPANASLFYGKNGAIESTYIKRFLTPFGEYMPLRELAEFVSPYAKSVNDFKPGERFALHKISGYPVAPIICYEIINDGIVREAALNSNALIVQTNSATFAKTAESAQQLAITRIRAVEHSREILSVSTVGISAFIDNNGAVKSQSAENVSTLLADEILLSNQTTFADRLGGVAPLLVLFLAMLSSLLGTRRGDRR